MRIGHGTVAALLVCATLPQAASGAVAFSGPVDSSYAGGAPTGSPVSVVAGDWNRDGRMDAAASLGGTFVWGSGDGEGRLRLDKGYGGSVGLGMVTADVTRDGFADVVSSDGSNR